MSMSRITTRNSLSILLMILFLAMIGMSPNFSQIDNPTNRFQYAYEYDPPTVSPHPDVTFTFGQTGVILTWNVSDENPQMYKIWINGVFVLTNPWHSNETSISYDVSWLPVGKHNLSIILFDVSGTTNYDDVVVTVLADTSVPVIIPPPRLTYTEGESENYLVWEIYDLNPFYFEISLRGNIVYSEHWTSKHFVVTFNVDGLDVGGYMFKLTAYGMGGDSVGRGLVIVHPD
jgi:hypothetical protein